VAASIGLGRRNAEAWTLRPFPLAALGAVAALLLAVAGSAQAARLVPHRAFYTLSLDQNRPGSGIVDVIGAMSYSLEDGCSVWLLEQRIDMRRELEQGAVTTSIAFTSWESKDGLRYGFRLRTYNDGQLSSETKGEARLEGRGRGGRVRYTEPERRSLDLGSGTYFPMAHLAAVIDRALAGQSQFVARLFDGGDDDGPYVVSALTGVRKVPAATKPALPHAEAMWPVQMAFFPATSLGDVPTYEIRLDLYDNGIAGAISLDYGEFVLGSEMRMFEALPRPRC